MNDAYFKPMDMVAFEKAELFAQRRAELEPPAPPPTMEQLWGDRFVEATDTVKSENNRLADIQSQSRSAASSSSSSVASSSAASIAESLAPASERPLRYIFGAVAPVEPELSLDVAAEASSLVLRRARRSEPVDTEEAHAWLSTRGFDPDLPRKPRDFGWAPYHQATEEASLGMLEWLHANGAAEDIRRRDDAGMSPLNVASQNRDLAVTRWLYNHGAAEVYKYDPHLDASGGLI